MIVSYDTEAGATYVQFKVDARIARTIEISDLVMVDVDAVGEPIGVEFAVPPEKITDNMLHRLSDGYPNHVLKELAADRSWLLTHA